MTYTIDDLISICDNYINNGDSTGMSQDDIDMCDFCDSAGSDDTGTTDGGTSDGGNTTGGDTTNGGEQTVEQLMVEQQEAQKRNVSMIMEFLFH